MRSIISLFGLCLVSATAKDFSDMFKDLVEDVTTQIVDFVEENQEDINSIAQVIEEEVNEFADTMEIAARYIDSLLGQFDEANGGIPIKNATCISRHCLPEIAACGADATCRTNMECSAGCGQDNTTCTFYCSQSYKTSVVDEMFTCLFVDYECLSLPPPDELNNATCRNPTTTVETVEDDLLNGMWYVVQGFNPLYDCYACQELTFEITDGQIDYHALFSMIAVNGTEIWVTADMEGEDRSTSGALQMDGFDNGMPDHQTWYVMHSSEDTLMVYYCGNVLDAWHFEGLLIMSKTTELNPEREADLAQILADLEIADEEVCKLNPAVGCSDLSPASIFAQ